MIALEAVWPDWTIFCTLGKFLKPLTTINLPESPTFLGNFCKGVKIYHLSREIIFGQLLQTFGEFYLVTLTGGTNLSQWKSGSGVKKVSFSFHTYIDRSIHFRKSFFSLIWRNDTKSASHVLFRIFCNLVRRFRRRRRRRVLPETAAARQRRHFDRRPRAHQRSFRSVRHCFAR